VDDNHNSRRCLIKSASRTTFTSCISKSRKNVPEEALYMQMEPNALCPAQIRVARAPCALARFWWWPGHLGIEVSRNKTCLEDPVVYSSGYEESLWSLHGVGREIVSSCPGVSRKRSRRGAYNIPMIVLRKEAQQRSII